MKILKTAFVQVFAYIVDTIAPPDLAVRAIENMSVDHFIESANNLGNKSTEQPKPIDWAIHLFPYRTESGTTRTALITIKTYHNPKLIKILASATHAVLHEKLKQHETSEPFILIPVPMTRKSVRTRGWNQCELICREMARLDKLETSSIFDYRPNVLIKIRETTDQVGQNHSGRFENLKHSYRVQKDCTEFVRNKDVIVLDDIITTGSTLSEAKRALLAAGAKTVLCVAVAH